MNVDTFLERLCEIPGIGKWTAQYIAMRALGEPDAFPTGDLGLLHALELENSRDLEKRAESWRPWRAYAAMYLWNSLRSVSVRQADPKSRKLRADKGTLVSNSIQRSVQNIRLTEVANSS